MQPINVIPRFYQNDLFNEIQSAIRIYRGVCVEAPTGSGKSVLLAMIINAIVNQNNKWKLNNRVYIVVHAKFLLDQMDAHLEKWRIPHGVIKAGKYERPGVDVHVCTYQSLIKRPPKDAAVFIIDEAHRSGAISYLTLAAMFPDAKIIGVTASPERTDGKGLKYRDDKEVDAKDQGLFDTLIKCPLSMLELTELGYLAPIKYYAPPLPGIESVGVTMGEYNTEEIEKFLQEKGVYGDAITHYEKIAPGSKCLVFNKSVKSCYSFADSLNERGYKAAPLEGSHTDRQRKNIIERFENGELTHITTCKLVLEGFDMPAIESVLDLSPTLSRGLWHQKKGRLARPNPGKEYGIYIDCVGNVAQNTETGNIYEIVNWQFDGTEYNKKHISVQARDQYCPLCFAYIPPPGSKCPNCGAEKRETPKPEKKAKYMEGDLIEVTPVPMRDREDEEKRELQDKINHAIIDHDMDALIAIGRTITTEKKLPFWIYHKMTDKKGIVDIPLLYRIQRQLQYKPGWVYFAKNQIKVGEN